MTQVERGASAIHVVYEAGQPPHRSYDWGKGYVTRSTDTLGYSNDRAGVSEFLKRFLASDDRARPAEQD